MAAHETIRWGIASTGKIAAAMTTALRTLPDAEVVAVGSRSLDAADAFASRFGIPNVHGSHDALYGDDDVDIVYVASPHSHHHAMTIDALDAGRHVLCEKAFALNAAQAREMVAAAARNDRFLMEAMWTWFIPAVTEVKRRVDAGEIGELRLIEADFGLPIHDEQGRHRRNDLAGGALLDLGIYPMTLAWWVLGEPDRIQHVGRLAATGADDEVALLCSWADGAVALLTCSTAVSGSMEARIEGTEGVVVFPAPAHASGSATIRRGLDTEEITGQPASLHHQVVEVHRCLRDGLNESPRMPWATSRAMLARFDEIRRDLGVVYPGE